MGSENNPSALSPFCGHGIQPSAITARTSATIVITTCVTNHVWESSVLCTTAAVVDVGSVSGAPARWEKGCGAIAKGDGASSSNLLGTGAQQHSASSSTITVDLHYGTHE